MMRVPRNYRKTSQSDCISAYGHPQKSSCEVSTRFGVQHFILSNVEIAHCRFPSWVLCIIPVGLIIRSLHAELLSSIISLAISCALDFNCRS